MAYGLPGTYQREYIYIYTFIRVANFRLIMSMSVGSFFWTRNLPPSGGCYTVVMEPLLLLLLWKPSMEKSGTDAYFFVEVAHFLWRLHSLVLVRRGGRSSSVSFHPVVRRCPFYCVRSRVTTVHDGGPVDDDDDERRVILCVRHKIQNSIVVTHDSCTRER